MRWPWKRQVSIRTPYKDTGGRCARERAEEALRDVRQRHSTVAALRAALARDLQKNHYRDSVAELFRGGRA